MPDTLSLGFLGVAVSHLLGAGRRAFRTLRVAAYERLDGTDLASVWSGPDPDPVLHLTRRILVATRRNRDGVNAKVTGIKMSHAFLGRAVPRFGAPLLLQVAWCLLADALPQAAIGARDAICRRG